MTNGAFWHIPTADPPPLSQLDREAARVALDTIARENADLRADLAALRKALADLEAEFRHLSAGSMDATRAAGTAFAYDYALGWSDAAATAADKLAAMQNAAPTSERR